jgi:hypothetical protein
MTKLSGALRKNNFSYRKTFFKNGNRTSVCYVLRKHERINYHASEAKIRASLTKYCEVYALCG